MPLPVEQGAASDIYVSWGGACEINVTWGRDIKPSGPMKMAAAITTSQIFMTTSQQRFRLQKLAANKPGQAKVVMWMLGVIKLKCSHMFHIICLEARVRVRVW